MKTKKKSVQAEAPVEAVATPVVALTKPESEDEFEWTPQRLKTLDMILAGVPKTQIAKEVGVSRQTIITWCSHNEFVKQFNEREFDQQSTTRQRRTRHSTNFTDRVAKIADTMLSKVEKDVNNGKMPNPAAVGSSMEWMGEFRRWRGEERINMGDNVQRHDYRVGVAGGLTMNHNGQQQGNGQQQSRNTSFKRYVEDGVASGVIDADFVDSADSQSVITSVAQQMLVEGTLIDQINEEDRLEEEANKGKR